VNVGAHGETKERKQDAVRDKRNWYYCEREKVFFY